MAAADAFVIRVCGRGGHGSAPHAAIDPIPVACEIVLALQLHVASSIDPVEPVVLTVGRFHAGTTSNVIPETAEIGGTFRAISERTRAQVHAGIARVADCIARAHGAIAKVDIRPGPPVTINDETATFRIEAIAAELLGVDNVIRIRDPVMASEDFSYILQHVPGTLVFLGTQPEVLPGHAVAGIHSSRMVIDESAMVVGMALYAEVARRLLWTPPL